MPSQGIGMPTEASGAQEVWELLYSSNQHGQSYHSLLMRAAGRGPALVIVRDKQGHVFGGFASVPLQKSGQYYGAVVCLSVGSAQ